MNHFLIAASDRHFAILCGEEGAPNPEGLAVVEGGLVDPRSECNASMQQLRALARQVGTVSSPCAWIGGRGTTIWGVGLLLAPPDASGAVEFGGYVAPSVQNKGWGVRFFASLIHRMAAESSIKSLVARTYVGNTRSQKILRYLGFDEHSSYEDETIGRFLIWHLPCEKFDRVPMQYRDRY